MTRGVTVYHVVLQCSTWCYSAARGVTVWHVVLQWGTWCYIVARGVTVWQAASPASVLVVMLEPNNAESSIFKDLN